MKKELEEKLYKEFPQFFKDHDKSAQETAMCWGCQCDDGWYDLIRETCLELSNLDLPEEFTFNTVKQKFGRLLIYAESSFSYVNDTEEALDILHDAADKSKGVCEWCGSKDDVSQGKKSWIRHLCHKCHNNYDQIMSDKWEDK